jgi:hypothetical protein
MHEGVCDTLRERHLSLDDVRSATCNTHITSDDALVEHESDLAARHRHDAGALRQVPQHTFHKAVDGFARTLGALCWVLD